MDISGRIEHTLLSADATEEKIKKLCAEAKEYRFRSVCVNSCYVPLCVKELYGSGVLVGSVIGFPLGSMSTEAKVCEAQYAIENGADEIDMVMNIGFFKSGKTALVEKDIREVKNACSGRVLKVILETCLLTEEEKVKACRLAVSAGSDYVKTSTGFSKGGATTEDVELMRKAVGNECKVKASGGIRDYKTALSMIKAGADTLGCSAGVQIIKEALENKEDQ